MKVKCAQAESVQVCGREAARVGTRHEKNMFSGNSAGGTCGGVDEGMRVHEEVGDGTKNLLPAGLRDRRATRPTHIRAVRTCGWVDVT